ncbi:MAG: sulfurtransferase [Chloroflexi bacterium]|nr:sulfurtransferase [Chloroflexota bacterium]
MPFDRTDALAETGWLEAHLNDPNLRVFDCTVFLTALPGKGMRRESGSAAWEAGHIPGSGFADLVNDLSDHENKLPMMMPPAEQFAAAMARYGVGDGTRVVLYDRATNSWAARVWWMLRSVGFDNAAVLNGGWSKWTKEGRPVSTEPPAYPPAQFTARPRPGLFAGKDDVRAAMDSGGACLINALSAEQHAGRNPGSYGRAGRIPTSVNVPAGGLVDPETNAYLPAGELRSQFETVQATNGGRVITYCGGGIAASSDAFVLTLLGAENVAVYDGSLSEWAADPALPLEVG